MLPDGFGENVAFQHALLPEITRIVRQHAGLFVTVRLANKAEDMKQATDMVVDISNSAKMAVRIRRYAAVNTARKVYRDFTIRSYNGGNPTELDKLKQGFGDWYLYAWENASGQLDEYILVNLAALRTSGLLTKGYKETPNADGRTKFISIDLKALLEVNALEVGRVFADGYLREWKRQTVAVVLDLPEHLKKDKAA